MSEKGQPQYSRDDVVEILQRAAERMSGSSTSDAVLHDELIQSAREAGLDPAAVEEAAAQLEVDRENEKAVEAWRVRKMRGFISHLVSWLIVSGGLGILATYFGIQGLMLCPIVVWGMFVALHAFSAMRPVTEEDVQKVVKRQRRRRERAAAKREARRARERRRKIGKDFEAAVTTLIATATKKLEQSARSTEPRADSEFNRYVARQEAQPAGQPAPPSPRPVRARVEDLEVEDDERSSRTERRRRR